MLDENGVLILGPSGSRKTTLLLAALGQGATYVANDRVLTLDEPNVAEQCRCLTSVVPAFEVVMGEGAHREVSALSSLCPALSAPPLAESTPPLEIERCRRIVAALEATSVESLLAREVPPPVTS